MLRNHHPTVKPLALMRYLVRLTKTPTGGLVLDPFAGSGTTGMACVMEGRDFVGVELDESYCAIARARIAEAAMQRVLL
jgi:site-specific DNA-methyltransferase (adenine-specific)